jgi:hypothetical protein
MNMSRTNIIGIVAILIFVAAAGVFGGFLFILSNAKGELAVQQNMVADIQSRQQELSSLVRLVSETEPEREELYSYILQEDGVIDFLTLIESLGRQQGVLLETKGLTVVPIDDAFEALQVGVSVEGSYESITYLLALFEALPQQSSVEKVSLSQSGQSAAWEAAFTLLVTKYKES